MRALLFLLLTGCVSMGFESKETRLARDACGRNDPAACMKLGQDLETIDAVAEDTEREQPSDDPTIHAMEHDRRVEEIVSAYTRACQGGIALGCAHATVWLHDSGHDDLAADTAVRGCELDLIELCSVAALYLGDRDQPRAYQLAGAACARGDEDACEAQALVTTDPGEARAIRAAACQRGRSEACSRLGREAADQE